MSRSHAQVGVGLHTQRGRDRAGVGVWWETSLQMGPKALGDRLGTCPVSPEEPDEILSEQVEQSENRHPAG